jgi:hypothetical protein
MTKRATRTETKHPTKELIAAAANAAEANVQVSSQEYVCD